MQKNNTAVSNKPVFAQPVIDFVTVAHEYCVFINNTDKYSKADFVKVASQLLPLLYLKMSLLPAFEQKLDDEPQETVTEYDYEQARLAVRRKLSRHDDYLEVFRDDMQRSETPIVANVSEDLADLYQDLMNFCETYRIGVDELMNDALALVQDHFRNYWGQRLCNALRALHSTLYGFDDLDDEKLLSSDSLPTNDDDDPWLSPNIDF